MKSGLSSEIIQIRKLMIIMFLVTGGIALRNPLPLLFSNLNCILSLVYSGRLLMSAN